MVNENWVSPKRRAALEFAVRLATPGSNSDDIVKTAEAFRAFLDGGDGGNTKTDPA